jgi:predicted secreted protein
MRCIPFVVVMLLITFSSVGQEINSAYEFLGFSDDLKFIAFETHIPPPVEDSSPYSKIIFVDVEKNSWATKPLSLTGKNQQSMENVIAANKSAAKPLFTKYKITPGKNLGNRISLKMTKDVFHRDVASDTQVFVIDNVRYTLELHSFDTGEEHPAFFIQKQKFELVVKYNGKTQVLQKDNTVPASRGFTTGYSILSVYHSGPRLVVFMEYRNPGFEGYPDSYNMVVTGVVGK